jgi:hypothetical protein
MFPAEHYNHRLHSTLAIFADSGPTCVTVTLAEPSSEEQRTTSVSRLVTGNSSWLGYGRKSQEFRGLLSFAPTPRVHILLVTFTAFTTDLAAG